MVSARAAEQFQSASNLALSGEATETLELGEIAGRDVAASPPAMDTQDEEQEPRPPYAHAMLAGGLGGLSGDMLMHSLDTVKTRQQGDPHRPPKYHSLLNTYYTIFRQEGFRRGLYGGVLPAFVGSFSGTSIFFGAYEFTKRWQIDMGIAPSIAYLNAGFLADLAASPVYVPTEVLKTRLQLQGRYNNPFFKSGYNYKSTLHAMRTIYRTEGMAALFHGYGATLWRDLPFSALQFVFYEKERQWAKSYMGSKDIGLSLEILTGVTAGGLAGVITCPLDVVKTRMQTQLQPAASPPSPQLPTAAKDTTSNASSTIKQVAQKRTIFTHAPHSYKGTPATLDTSSVIKALRIIYQSEGIAGWFRGVGPRGVWTSVQSGTMLVLYQQLLSLFDKHWDVEDS